MTYDDNNRKMLEEMAMRMSSDVYPVLLQKMREAGIKTVVITADITSDYDFEIHKNLLTGNKKSEIKITLYDGSSSVAEVRDSGILDYTNNEYQRQRHFLMNNTRNVEATPTPTEEDVIRRIGGNGVEIISKGMKCPVFWSFSEIRTAWMRGSRVDYFSYCKEVFDTIDAISDEQERRKNIFTMFDKIPVTRRVMVEKITKNEKAG